MRYVLGVTCLALSILLWRGLSLDPSHVPSALINKPLPEFKLTQLKKSDLLGQVSLITVWATWCRPCRAEHPDLIKLTRENKLNWYGISYKDDPNSVNHWLKEMGNPFRINTHDFMGRVVITWGVYGTPETFITDKQGIIRYHHIGPINQIIWQEKLKPVVDQYA